MRSQILIALGIILIGVLYVHVHNQIKQENQSSYMYTYYYKGLDMNRDGVVTFDDYFNYMKELNEEDNIGYEDARDSFRELDPNSDGILEFSEFVALAPELYYSGIKKGPREIHISLTNISGIMQVMWVTPKQNLSFPQVHYGLSKDNLAFAKNGTWHTYNVGHLGFHGRIYVAQMENLLPKTKYYYKVGDAENKEFSKVIQFTSAPLTGDPEYLDFAVFGDMGTIIPFGHWVSKQIERDNNKHHYNFSLLAGDVAYAGIGNEQQGELEPIWDIYGDQIQPWASKMPFMPGVGNHEKYYNYTAYINRYILPVSPGSGDNFYFSFDYGSVHVLHMSTESDYSVGSPQYNFIVNDLQKASSNPGIHWIIFAGHRPMYSSDASEQDQHWPGAPLLTIYEPILKQYKVDLSVTGHMHCYERTTQVYNGTVITTPGSTTHLFQNPVTPIYVVQGTAGALMKEKWIKPKPEWSVSRIARFGYGRVRIYENGTLHYQFLKWTALGNEIYDEFWINKQIH